MKNGIIVTGTDTGVGKTILSAILTLGLNARYWKPVQCGLEQDDFGTTDRERVTKLTGLGSEQCLPEAYIFEHPISPHAAALLDGVEIDLEKLHPKNTGLDFQDGLIIESAGGVLVPIAGEVLSADWMKMIELPVIVCARTKIGTINHTLLTLEALKARGIPVLGVVFSGSSDPIAEGAVISFSKTPILGRIPILSELSAEILLNVFENHFDSKEIYSAILPKLMKPVIQTAQV